MQPDPSLSATERPTAFGGGRTRTDHETKNTSPAKTQELVNPTLLDYTEAEALMQQLLQQLAYNGFTPDDLATVQQAYVFARDAHGSQTRKDGQPYITHPVSVALILAAMRVDLATIVAALLHDVLEDTPITTAQMAKQFGADITALVEGVTKLGRYHFSSKEEQNAENFRKMFLAMAQDVRVITLKLADRLHNMRTLDHMKPEKQVKIARETMDIFAPLANRMGMGNIRAELEDLALQYLDADAYQLIENELAHTRSERERTIALVTEKIRGQLDALGIESRIYGRVKNYYSIYKKMTRQQKELQAIFDISALRVIVGTEKECYEVLGVIHNLFTPVPGRFKDYIAMPKSNFYQSLHTTVFGVLGRPLEVQIRTQRMHEVAEYGIAAHFKYKETGLSTIARLTQDDQKLAWLKQMAEMQTETGNALEFVESVKLDFFPDQVFVFTPKGEVISLPKGSTPVDFAFRIHTEVGNHCAGAIVNERMLQLDTELRNGDIVEIITNKKATPRLDWVNFVKTQHAKTRIRQWYKRHYRQQHAQQGKALLEAELTRAHFDAMSNSGRLAEVARELNYQTEEDLLVGVGYGEVSLPKVLNRLRRDEAITAPTEESLFEEEQRAEAARKRASMTAPRQQVAEKTGLPASAGRSAPVEVTALKGLVHHIARCCSPVPGDAIMGIVTRSRGVMIHREGCTNTLNANPERVMQLSWDGPIRTKQRRHAVTVEVTAIDRIGLLKDILAQVCDAGLNVSNAKSNSRHADRGVTIELTLDVMNLDQLEQVMEQIRRVPDVIAVRRQTYRLNQQNPRYNAS